MSHGWKEQIYHPLLYKVQPCNEIKCSQDMACGYYHRGMGDRRFVERVDLLTRLSAVLAQCAF